MDTLRSFAVLLVLTSLLASDSPSSAATPISRSIENFQLQDHLGAGHELVEWSDRKAVVVAFLGTECPLASFYGPRLAELAAEYGPRGVAFVGIDSNQQDSLAEIGQYVRRHQIEFPMLKDPGNKVADQFGADARPKCSCWTPAAWCATTGVSTINTAWVTHVPNRITASWRRRLTSCWRVGKWP